MFRFLDLQQKVMDDASDTSGQSETDEISEITIASQKTSTTVAAAPVSRLESNG